VQLCELLFLIVSSGQVPIPIHNVSNLPIQRGISNQIKNTSQKTPPPPLTTDNRQPTNTKYTTSATITLSHIIIPIVTEANQTPKSIPTEKMEQAMSQLTPQQRQAVMMKAQQEANQQIMQSMIEKMVATCFKTCAGTSVGHEFQTC
jgi:hypothetical protein